MTIDKSAVLIGVDSDTNLSIYRRFLYFKAARDQEIIQVFYDEFLMSNNKEVFPYRKSEIHYRVKDLRIGDVPNQNQEIMTNDFYGFTDWYNHSLSGLPEGYTLGDILVASINSTLQTLVPIGAVNGYTVTSSL